MKFTVLELQNGVAGSNCWTYDTLPEAEAKYHATLAVAATSSVRVHAAVIINEAGFLVRSQAYTHPEVEE